MNDSKLPALSYVCLPVMVLVHTKRHKILFSRARELCLTCRMKCPTVQRNWTGGRGGVKGYRQGTDCLARLHLS